MLFSSARPALKLLDSSVFASHLPVGGQELQVNVSPLRVLVIQNLVSPLTRQVFYRMSHLTSPRLLFLLITVLDSLSGFVHATVWNRGLQG